MNRAFLALALIASLAGCQAMKGVGMVVGPTAITPAAAEPTILKAEVGFTDFYNASARSYLLVKDKLSPTQKVAVKAVLARMYDATMAANDADALGQATTLQARIDELKALAADAAAIISGKAPT